MNVTLQTLATLSVLVFVICSMGSMGLGLRLSEIAAPLSRPLFVASALLANFVIAPIVAIGLTVVLPLNTALSTGLILLSTAAGAPFLPKLVDLAKGSAAFAVATMVLLMVATIVYLPVVLPLLLEGVEVQPWKIARSLIVLMLLPLALGLIVRARYEEAANGIRPALTQAANVGLILLVVLGVALNFNSMIALVGSFGILAAILFIVAMLIVGFLLAGRSEETRSVLALGTAQRNISAALVVAGQNFGLDVVTYLLVFSVIGLVILLPGAGELGKRAQKGNRQAA